MCKLADCSQLCDVDNNNKAMCKCNAGYELDADMKTCNCTYRYTKNVYMYISSRSKPYTQKVFINRNVRVLTDFIFAAKTLSKS